MKILIALLAVFLLSACTARESDVTVYEDTENRDLVHEEKTITAVYSFRNADDTMGLIDFQTGQTYILGYHGGVFCYGRDGRNISIGNIGFGTVVDCTYNTDTKRIVSLKVNSDTMMVENVKKFRINIKEKKALYGASSAVLWEKATAYGEDGPIQIDEVSTEDVVTLSILNGTLVSVVVNKSHGYVRLLNQESYIGGMVEVGYDVIYPVTEDMLLIVGEGSYTLRVTKNGYEKAKPVVVKKGSETVVDLIDVAVPDGTVAFEYGPYDVRGVHIYVNGEEIFGRIYTNQYGSYVVRATAENYADIKGVFTISKSSETKKLMFTQKTEEDTTEQTTTEAPSTATPTDAKTTAAQTTSQPDVTAQTTENTITPLPTTEPSTAVPTETQTPTVTQAPTESTTTAPTTTAPTTEATTLPPWSTEEGRETDNEIRISTPAGVGVYMDGDYIGTTPVTVKKVVGTHTVTLYQSGFIIKTYTVVAVDDGQDMILDYPELVRIGD